jgi:hypothetical protein
MRHDSMSAVRAGSRPIGAAGVPKVKFWFEAGVELAVALGFGCGEGVHPASSAVAAAA